MNCIELPSHTWRDPELVSVDLIRQLEKPAYRLVGPRDCELWVAETRVPYLVPLLSQCLISSSPGSPRCR